MSVTIKVASVAPVLATLYRAGDGLDPQLARTLQDINDASFYLSFFPLTVLLAAFAIVAIQSGALPKWLGWMSAVVAAALLVDGMAGTLYPRDFGPSFLLFLLWTVITSVVLMRRAGQPLPTVESAHRD